MLLEKESKLVVSFLYIIVFISLRVNDAFLQQTSAACSWDCVRPYHSPQNYKCVNEMFSYSFLVTVFFPKKLISHVPWYSEETRVKIGLGVRKGWQLRRQKMTVQVICCLQWQNLIAEASRKGFLGGGQLQWDSFKNMDEMLEEEWLKSVNMRKAMLKPKGSRRALKSPEQRRKISEAISAKWADPVSHISISFHLLVSS